MTDQPQSQMARARERKLPVRADGDTRRSRLRRQFNGTAIVSIVTCQLAFATPSRWPRTDPGPPFATQTKRGIRIPESGKNATWANLKRASSVVVSHTLNLVRSVQSHRDIAAITIIIFTQRVGPETGHRSASPSLLPPQSRSTNADSASTLTSPAPHHVDVSYPKVFKAKSTECLGM